MPTRYVHTNIVANDWRQLARFYESVFDCVPVPPVRDHSGEWLEDGTGVRNASATGIHLRLPGDSDDGPTIEIYTYQSTLHGGEPAANRRGYGHVAFAVDDVARTVQNVVRHGGRPHGKVVTRVVESVGTITFAYVQDPEGNLIEVQKWESLPG